MAKCCSFPDFFEFLHTISKKLIFSEKTNTADARLNHLNGKLSLSDKHGLILSKLFLKHFYLFYCNLLMQRQKYYLVLFIYLFYKNINLVWLNNL